MTSILVSGSSGFIGSHLLPVLRSAGHETIPITRQSGDVADESMWKTLPRAEVVIHLAGKSFVPDSWKDPSAFIATNLLGTVGALEYCRKHQARLVFVSSYMYGDPSRLPIDEQAPLVAKNPYAFSKMLAEEACSFFGERFGIDVIVLRPFNVFGEGQSEAFLIPSIIKQVRQRRPINVKDLRPKRDYLYVSDMVDAIFRAVRGPKGFNVLNVGSGMSHSVADVIEIVQDVWHTDLPVVSAEEQRQDEIMDVVADIRKAGRELDWKPRFSLREGLEDMRSVSAQESLR